VKIKYLFIAFVLGLGLTVALLWLLSASSTEPPVARAASLHVCPSGCTYSSIQAAADAASDGDVIKVATGTYTDVHARARADIVMTGVITQVVYISKSVTIRGGYTTAFTDPPDPVANPTTLDAQGQGRVLYITGDISPEIEGLHITHGDAADLGGGVVLNGNAGGGMYAISASVILRYNQVSNNTASGPYSGGGGVYVGDGQVTLSHNTIISNTSEAGGGLALLDSQAILAGNHIISNTAQLVGGGVGFGSGSRVSITGDRIISNTAQSGGGVYATYGSSADIKNSIVQANRAVGDALFYGGGGIWVGASSLMTLTNTVVKDNQAVQGSPGIAIQVSDAHLLHITIAANSGGSGSGLELFGGSAALTNTILVSHSIGITVAAGSTATLDGVLWFGNGANTGGAGALTVTHEHTGDPAFAADGYHLTSTSAAIDQGVNAGVKTDIDAQPRFDPAPDLGADEYWAPGALKRFYFPIILRQS
jgi:hypothetical protein